MVEISQMTEEELRRRLRDLEQEQDTWREKTKDVHREEEEEEETLQQSYYEVEAMREACRFEDGDILNLLDEKQSILNLFKRQKSEFAQKFKTETEKRYVHKEMEEQDIYSQIRRLQEQEN